MEQKQIEKNDLKNFLKLQESFPLQPLNNNAELEQALEVTAQLAVKDDQMTNAERNYFKILSTLISVYEQMTVKRGEKGKPQESLRYLMKINNLRQRNLAPLVSESHLSDFLHGRRSLSAVEAARLGAFFHVEPSLFREPIKSISQRELSKLIKQKKAS